MLDFVSTADQFGKPVNADLKLGLATAPVLYAARTYPELWPLIERKFSQQGDVAKVRIIYVESERGKGGLWIPSTNELISPANL